MLLARYRCKRCALWTHLWAHRCPNQPKGTIVIYVPTATTEGTDEDDHHHSPD